MEYSEAEILNRYRRAYAQPWGRSRLRLFLFPCASLNFPSFVLGILFLSQFLLFHLSFGLKQLTFSFSFFLFGVCVVICDNQ